MSNQNNNQNLRYPVVRNLPVARFYYQGKHSHPVRRTVLVTEVTPRYLKGYELREGDLTRPANNAPIKSFLRSKIALNKQCGRRLKSRLSAKALRRSTLTRSSLLDAIAKGI